MIGIYPVRGGGTEQWLTDCAWYILGIQAVYGATGAPDVAAKTP